MAKVKHRYIQTDIWDRRWFKEFSNQAKLLYLYLLTCPLSNIAGIMEIMDDRIQYDIRFDDQIFISAMEELIRKKEVKQIDDIIIILRHPEFQKWDTHKNIAKGILSTLEDLPENLFSEVVNSKYNFPPIFKKIEMQDLLRRINEKADSPYTPLKLLGRLGFHSGM